MSSLRERLEAKPLEQTVLIIRGEKFAVNEIDRAERSRILASCTDKHGVRDYQKLEGVLLSRCVRDHVADAEIYSVDEWSKWDALGSGITGPLMAEVMRHNGLDSDDVGREVKNSETTTS